MCDNQCKMFLFSGPLLPNVISSHCMVEYKGQIIITGGRGLVNQGTKVMLFRLNGTKEIMYVPCITKVIIEKSCGGRFLWNRNWDLGWILAKWPTFLSFIASKSFDLWNHYIPQKHFAAHFDVSKFKNIWNFKKTP